MLTAILILVILIGLSVSCLLVKVEKIHKKCVEVITIVRQRNLVNETIKDLEARGWIVKEVKSIDKDHLIYEITIFR